eukprot:447063_1
MSYPTVTTSYINGWIVYTSSISLHLVLLYSLCNSYKTITKSSKFIKIVIIFSLIFSILTSLSWISLNISNYLISTSTSYNRSFDMMHRSSFITGYICQCLHTLFVGYFLKLKLEHTYNDRFFAINKRLNNLYFIIYAISSIFYQAMYSVYMAIDCTLCEKIQYIATIQWMVISFIYCILLLSLFYIKLGKFLLLTMSNDKEKCSDLNQTLKYYITKQTNLISIIVLMIMLHIIFTYIAANVYALNTTAIFLYQWNYLISQGTLSISQYLTFNINHKYYALYCKYCHIICVSIIDRTKNNSTENQPLLMKQNEIKYPQFEIVEITSKYNQQTSCLNMNKCLAIQSICKILDEYNVGYVANCSTTSILNDFHHVLMYHDSADAFHKIHEQLCHNNLHSHYSQCDTYSRHYSRRRNPNQLEKNEEQKTNEDNVNRTLLHILDKIHSFYYHSYDTYLRNTLSAADNRNIVKMCKSMNLSKSENIQNNKFSSSLSINDTCDGEHIYSFGQRFEYEDGKHKWYIGPKYNTFKTELTENDICNIPIDIYYTEYDKCKQYFNDDHVKMLQNRNTRHELLFPYILAILIYCNCDEYQNKLSFSFRKISNNETKASLLKRHSYFYHSSKYLRTLVEQFGSKCIDKNHKHDNMILYHGVSEVLYLTRTITQFNGPLSTSREINVALRFSNNVGIILALKYSFSTYPLRAKYLNCMYFSDYVNEQECLFIGGIPMMIITNIINVGNGMIYQKYINSLNIIN